jgi:large subunit ribosomal protein L24
VIAGKDKGKTGIIIKVLPKLGTVIVEGVNIKTKHIAPRGENEQGQIKKQEYPLHHSNVQHFSKEKQVVSRVGHRTLEDGRKVRYLIKTGENLD